MKLSKEDTGIMYDSLYDLGNSVLTRFNPCNIRREDGELKCSGNLRSCCFGCKHLTSNGCSVKALSCKLWLCDIAAVKSPEAFIALKTLKEVGHSIGLDTYSYGKGYRASKEEVGL